MRDTEFQELLAENFPSYLQLKVLGKCPFCYGEVEVKDFKDFSSLEEFRISGLCQDCQDEIL